MGPIWMKPSKAVMGDGLMRARFRISSHSSAASLPCRVTSWSRLQERRPATSRRDHHLLELSLHVLDLMGLRLL